jgi:ssDNA-binding Zn-finger/Zn-ribbon topoisomerase 1
VRRASPTAVPARNANGPYNDQEVMKRPEIRCKRCGVELAFLDNKLLHTGTNWGILGEIGEIFVEKNSYDLYACPICGGVEWFLPLDQTTPRDPAHPVGFVWTCHCGQANLRAEGYCKRCAAERE